MAKDPKVWGTRIDAILRDADYVRVEDPQFTRRSITIRRSGPIAKLLRMELTDGTLLETVEAIRELQRRREENMPLLVKEVQTTAAEVSRPQQQN